MVITTPRRYDDFCTSTAITPALTAPRVGGKTQVGDTISDVTAPTSWPAPPSTRNWLATALAGLAAVLAAAAFIVALTHTTTAPQQAATTTPAAPTYTAAETAEAQRQLCDTYKLAARAVRADTNGPDKALARIATTNGAVMLYGASASPALDVEHRDAARSLAEAYSNASAMGNRTVADDTEWQQVSAEVNTRDAAMSGVCGG